MVLKISQKKLKKILVKIPKFLIEHILLVLVFCFVSNVFTGLYIFYQYSFLPEIKEIKTEKKPLVIKEEISKDILKELDKKQERFQETEFREYPDLFTPLEILKFKDLTFENGNYFNFLEFLTGFRIQEIIAKD